MQQAVMSLLMGLAVAQQLQTTALQHLAPQQVGRQQRPAEPLQPLAAAAVALALLLVSVYQPLPAVPCLCWLL
jgi:hypothetical protein